MNRRRLVVLGGILVVAAALYRRSKRRDGVAIEIDDPEPREQPTEEAASPVELESIEGIGPSYAERLHDAGVDDAADLAAANAGTLAEETGIGERRIRGWIESVGELEDA